MSVINKVLRDLDQRKTSPHEDVVTRPHAALRAGTNSVASPVPRAPVAPRSRVPMVGAWVFGVAGLMVAAWWLTQGGNVALTAAAHPPVPSASALQTPPEPAPAPKSAPVAVAPPMEDTARTAPWSVFRSESRLNLKGWAGSMSDVPVPPAATPHITKPQAAPPTVTAAAEPLPAAQRQQMAVREALAQAQSLWSSGARDAAVDLLQEAIAAAERNLVTTPGSANTQTLASLVREWARMLLAESRPAPVWDLLSRLEPQLRNEADLWAVRANAAQRLGRHQDSVHAYVTALQSRPNEQRWMLGAAVSLAALGQTTAAAEMAERARTVGPISRDVQTYLRQTGVPLKEQ